MTCTCNRPEAKRVTLVDGTVCCTWCPAWLHECEARHVLNLKPLSKRQDYLNGTHNEFGRLSGGILQRCGPQALKRLQDTMTALWKQRTAEAKAQVLGRTQTPANDGSLNDEPKAA